jgi:hypothetical protein
MKNSQNKGWVRLHRKIEDNELWFLEPFTKAQAWIDLFLNANYKDGSIQIRGNILNIKRGQIGWSELTMVKRWRWSKNKVRRFLKWLETIQQIKQQKDRFLTTIITILNYEDYQEDKNDTADDTAERQQTIHKQEVKKDNKDNKDIVANATEPFSFNNEIEKLKSSKRLDHQIIGWYFVYKEFIPPATQEQFIAHLKRELRPANTLKVYPLERIKEVMKWMNGQDKLTNIWVLETVLKFIDKDLTKINFN